MRRQRAGVEDRWFKSNGEPSTRNGIGRRWRARYVDERGREHNAMFARKTDAQQWLNGQVAAVVGGRHVAPRDAQITVAQWCQIWLDGYKVHRSGTVRAAGVHIGQIVEAFGHMQLSAVRPSQVKLWTAKLSATYEPSYVYALHSRFRQIMADAVHDGVLGRNPCGRKTSPPKGTAKVYVATTEQVWALHDAMPDRLKIAVLLGAFAGLRVAEVSGLRVSDVDFMKGVVHPKVQWGGKPLKTDGSDAPVPIPRDLALMLSASVQKYGGDYMVTNSKGKPCPPWDIERAIRNIRTTIPGLPEGFTFHDLRHYLASLLVASGADIKTVQARLRHALASTTLDTYGHLWPDADESTRIAVGKVITARLAENAVGDG
jgi:integrase